MTGMLLFTDVIGQYCLSLSAFGQERIGGITLCMIFPVLCDFSTLACELPPTSHDGSHNG